MIAGPLVHSLTNLKSIRIYRIRLMIMLPKITIRFITTIPKFIILLQIHFSMNPLHFPNRRIMSINFLGVDFVVVELKSFKHGR